MASAYSQDLRDRVIDAVVVEKMSCRAAARRYGVSVSSAIKWVQRFRRTAERGPVGTGGHPPRFWRPNATGCSRCWRRIRGSRWLRLPSVC